MGCYCSEPDNCACALNVMINIRKLLAKLRRAASAVAGRATPLRAIRGACWVGILVASSAALAGMAAESAQTPEQGATNVDLAQQEWLKHQAQTAQEHYRLRVPVSDAVRDSVMASHLASPPPLDNPREPLLSGTRYQDIILGTLIGVAVFLGARKLHSWGNSSSAVEETYHSADDDKAFAEFLASFRSGPRPAQAQQASSVPAVVATPAIAAEATTGTTRGQLESFYEQTQTDLRAMKMLAVEIGADPGGSSQKNALTELSVHVKLLKERANLPELLAVWQLTSSLEWLMRQVSERSNGVTPSALRTIGEAVQLLHELCKPGLTAEFTTTPPLRFLTVDDDLISRHAVSFALKKAFNQPDTASDGPAALALVSRLTYDAIFLDIQMPGMDGYELCAKIKELPQNKTTPIVFVTSHNDYESHAKSCLVGGTDLLGKPFLTFEITVKALTLALRSRLQARDGVAKPEVAAVVTDKSAVAATT
jgi:CheY-like chemotaxis protein